MSTLTNVGAPRVDLGPFPTEHPYSLYTVAKQLEGERWENGVSLLGYPDGLPSGFDPCSEGTFREKDESDTAPYGTFLGFTTWLGLLCSTMGMGSFEEFQARVNAALAAKDHHAAERQLAQGNPLDQNPYFGDTHLSILGGGGALTPGTGLAYLEEAIGATGIAGVLHATPAIASAWSFDGGLYVEDGRLYTWLGTPVVVGTGYIGTDPANGSTPAAGQGWAFASGPVVYGRGPLVELAPTAAETVDREINLVDYRAERDIVVAWDTALQAGVLIDWTP